MPWINLTLRRGAMPKQVQHALMAKLTDILMWWEKVPDTPRARSIMKGWVYEVDEDTDYSAGSPVREKPFYFIEIRIPVNRLDLLAKQGLIRDFTHVVLEAEKSANIPENARRIWVTITELKAEDWGSAAIAIGCATTPAPSTPSASTPRPLKSRRKAGEDKPNQSAGRARGLHGFSRHPVRKIHARTARHTAMNSAVNPRLAATLTSPWP